MSADLWMFVGVAAALAGGAGAFVLLRTREALSDARRREVELRYAAEGLQLAGEPDPYAGGPGGIPDVPTALVTSCAAGDSILFAGTGLSAAIGQPTWREALMRVLHICEEERPDPVWSRLIWEIDEEQYDLVADLLSDKLGRATFYNYLRRVVAAGGPGTDGSTLRWLENIPFAGAIANVWDDLAVELFSSRRPHVLGPGSATDFADVLRKDQFFVLNAYGSLADDSLLVTAEAFYEYLSDHTGYARFLGSIFATRTVLFVGTGVVGIEDAVRATTVRNANGRRHYALVPWSTEAELRRERLLRRYNVELLLYPPDPEHRGVDEFLGNLTAEVRSRRRAHEVKRRPVGVPLTGLVLENIGPFEALELDFAEDWNVLLANNGCGKSTILRSIALALCGDEERAIRVGGSLLNSNASSGSIQVRFGEDTFETRLVRESTRVRVMPRHVTPVQTGEWLVLGFPAIRGVSSRESSPALAPVGRGPVVDDVLPLLTSEVDSRLNDLTQWLLNNIYSDAVDWGISQLRRSRHPTVERFFRIIGRLGGGIELEFGGINRETSDVLVKTPDGEIPLQSLSQGMNSVLTWTGSLISRLEEIEQTGSRRDGHAGLLLVDEIDAHLHPSWQRQIIDAARSEFADVQFVVTTHSPLVVGSMSEGKLWRLFRDEEQRVCSEEFSARFRGWRADQILTSPLFDTDVRDPDTERLLEDYADLAALDEPSDEQEGTLREVAAELDVRLPNPEQKEDARRARDLIKHAAAAEIEAMPQAERDRILKELQVQVQEAIVDSRPRP